MKSTKIMLIAALTAGALIIGSSSLRAQDATNMPPPTMKGRPNFAKSLDLTEDQKPKFDAIRKSAMEKAKAVREDDSLTKEEKKAKAKAIQEDTATQMKALLTPEQFAKYEEMTKKMRRNKPPGGGAGAPPVAPAAPPQA
jgi:Spy/CpxP family protein refolding chaperone